MTAVRRLARVEDLRGEFDRAFATPHGAAASTLDFLTVKIGGDPYALRLSQVSGLFTDRRVTPLPSLVPGLLGLVGLRNVVAPVYDLRSLLGYPAGDASRFLVAVRSEETVAFSFDDFEAHVRVALDAISSAERTSGREYLGATLSLDSGPRPIVELSTIVASLVQRAADASSKET